MRHPHADIIHAWAEGQKIEVWSHENRWVLLPDEPRWTSEKYRIKPNTIKFRNFLWKACLFNPKIRQDPQICCVSEKDNSHEPREAWVGFIKWIGDWQEVEIDS